LLQSIDFKKRHHVPFLDIKMGKTLLLQERIIT
jgi:hypothetical protein